MIAALLAAACTSDDTADAEDATTTVVRSTAEDAPVAVGDCGDVPNLRVGGAVDPGTIAVVPCTEPHDVEIAAVFDHPSGPDADFPGTDAVDGYAFDECLQRFTDYVGAAYEASSLDVAFIAPGENGWDAGDRRVACVLYHVDFVPLTGSVRGTGQ